MRRRLLPPVVALLLGLILTQPSAAQSAVPSFDQFMTSDELAATGIERLSDDEQAALMTWLSRQVSAARTGGASGGAPAAPTPDDSRGLYWRVVPPTLEVSQTLEDGGTVQLEDGTLWVVKPEDRPATATWRTGESVVVKRILAPTGPYEFELINATAGSPAEAEFAGSAGTRESVRMQGLTAGAGDTE